MATAVPWVKRILWIIFLVSQQLVIGMDDPPDSVNPISGYTSHDPVTENSTESLQLTCSVTGVPNPNTLTYTWSSDCGTGGGVNSTLIPASTTAAMAPSISHISTIRLVNGGSPYEGRVEVYYSGSWGTICDDNWNDDAAGVVCRMLGYSAGTAVCCATFGSGLGSIWLDDVTCFGNETDIADCRHGNWSQHNCAHSEDAGVRCIGTFQISIPRSRTMNNKQCYCTVTHAETGWTQTSQPVTFNITYPPDSVNPISGYTSHYPVTEHSTESLQLTCSVTGMPNPDILTYTWSSDCRSGGGVNSTLIPASTITAIAPSISHISTIRLVNGSSRYEGRVEVYYSGSWGTICDDGWNVNAARVVCRMLGYSAGTAVCCATFGSGLGSIWLDDVTCFGNEADIADCRHGNWSQHNCAHREDAGVRCNGTHQINIPRSQTMNNKQCYCTVTHSETGWTQTSQPVTFNITYPPDSVNPISGYTSHYPVTENSTESLQLTCSVTGVPNPDILTYTWSSDCRSASGHRSPDNATVFLFGGSDEHIGTVSLHLNGYRGTICDDGWDNNDAKVICRMLGFQSDGAVAIPKARYGQDNGSIILDDVFCDGSEQSILNCSHHGLGVHNCVHGEDAGVICPGTSQISIPRSRTMNSKQCSCTVTHLETGWHQTSQPVTFNIIYKRDPPSDVRVMCGLTTAIVSWISQLTDGVKQTFHIEFENNGHIVSINADDPGNDNNKRTLTLTGLKSEQNYTFVMYTQNYLGRSKTSEISCQTKQVIASTTAPEASTSISVAAIATGVAIPILVSIVILVVVIFVKRRQKPVINRSDSARNNKSFTDMVINPVCATNDYVVTLQDGNDIFNAIEDDDIQDHYMNVLNCAVARKDTCMQPLSQTYDDEYFVMGPAAKKPIPSEQGPDNKLTEREMKSFGNGATEYVNTRHASKDVPSLRIAARL